MQILVNFDLNFTGEAMKKPVDKIANMYAVAKYLSFMSQIGLSMIIPLAIWIFIAVLLQRKFGLGSWVLIVGILLGVYNAACSFFKLLSVGQKDADKSEKKHKKY